MKIYRFIKVLTLLFIILISSATLAQKMEFKNKISLKLSAGTLNSGKLVNTKRNPLILIEMDYSINRYFDLGIYGGFSPIMHSYELPYNAKTGMYQWYSADSTSSMTSKSAGFFSPSKAYCYGITSNIHLLPLIYANDFRIDLYMTPKVGIISEHYYEYNATQELVWSKPFIEWGLGVGLKYSFTRHFGIYSEYSLGKFYNNNKSRMVAGIVIKF